MNKIKLMAMIAIMLIVSLPLYSAVAMASFLRVTSVHGEAGVDGYLKDKTSDTLTAEVDVFVDNDDVITVDQVRYGGSGASPRNPSAPGAQFDECAFIGPHHECTFSTSSISYFTNPKQLRFYLYDDAAERVATATQDIYIDELPPTVNSFIMNPSVASSGNVEFIFDIKDNACTGTLCVDRCSGINRIELSVGSHTETIDVNNDPDNCTYTGSKLVPVLTIEPGASSSIVTDLTATMTVYDNVGRATTTTKELGIDTTLPILDNLQVSVKSRSTASAVVDLTIDVTDDNLDTVIADLHELNINAPPDYSDKQALCASTGNNSYTCIWSNINMRLGSKDEAQITINATDAAGNSVEYIDTIDKATIFDITAPVYLGYHIRNLAPTAYEGAVKIGDALYITVNVSEEYSITEAYADISSIVAGVDNVEADSCTNQGDIWTCGWTTAPVELMGDSVLKFYFTDSGNNVLEQDIPITVLGLEGVDDVDYWDSTVECSPDRLDRELTSLVEMRSFCRVNLVKKDPGSDQEPLSVDLDGCVDTGDGSIGFISNAEAMNNQQESTSPYIKLKLVQQEATLDEINIKCSLNIISRIGGLVTNPEKEDVNIELGFYNNPLGEISNNIQSKIDDVESSIEGTWKIIGQLKKIVNYAEVACKLWEALKKIVVAIDGIKVILGGVEDSLTWFPPGEKAAYAARVASCNVEETIDNAANKGYKAALNKLCNFVNCKMGKAAAGDKGLTKWAKNLGGGSGIFGPESLSKFAESTGGGSIQYTNDGQIRGGTGVAAWTGKDPKQYMDVKNSLVLSTMTFCLPGMIYNLDKWRQIQCMYGTCLLSIEGVPGSGMSNPNSVPISMCEDQKEYLTCKFVMGEIFKVIPYTAIINYYTNMVKNAISDPFALLGVVIGLACQPKCTDEVVWPHVACSIAKVTTTVGEAIDDIKGIEDLSKNKWQVDTNYCNIFKEMKKQSE